MTASQSSNFLCVDGVPVPVRLKISGRARRFTLRLPPQENCAVLTLPSGVPETEIRQFLLRNAGWLESAMARSPKPVDLTVGVRIPVAGKLLRITLSGQGSRAATIYGDHLVFKHSKHIGPRTKSFLRERARGALVPAANYYAAQLGRTVTRIELRDTRTRWGSCSSNGTLSFSWRLAMAPPDVLDYVAAHEAAHLAEMNHGPSFWALVEQLRPDFEVQRSWLKSEGRSLHAYRFD